MRYVLRLILVLFTIYMSSCFQFDKNFEEGISQFLTGPILESTASVLAIEAFYLENDKWPSSKEELADFCFQNEWDDYGNYWKSCEDFNLKELDDGSLEIAYKNTTYQSNGGFMTYKGSITIPKPSGDKKAVREELDRLLIENNKNINNQLKET